MRALALVFVASVAHAAPQTFGARTIEIPEPVGFHAASAKAPELLQRSAAYLPTTNRLVEIYVDAADLAALASGKSASMRRYFQLQVLRDLEGRPLASADFDQIAAGMKTEMSSAMLDAEGKKLSAQGNEAIKKETGKDIELGISGPSQLKFYGRDETMLEFSMLVTTAIGAQKSRLVTAGGILLANHQLLYCYAYGPYTDESSRTSVETALAAWVTAIRNANPDDKSVVKSGFEWSSLGLSTIIGAVIGGLVGVVLMLVRRRRMK